MLICDLLSLTTMSTYTTIEHVEAVYDRDWTPGFVIIVIFLFQIMISHVYFQIYSILEKTYQLCTSEIMNLVLHIGIVWKRLGRKWLGLFKAREERKRQFNEMKFVKMCRRK